MGIYYEVNSRKSLPIVILWVVQGNTVRSDANSCQTDSSVFISAHLLTLHTIVHYILTCTNVYLITFAHLSIIS
mgnify:CR=1 FL=1